MSFARIRASAFHSRAAQANEANDWSARGGLTLARCYAGYESEALAARFRVGLVDLSWRWRVGIEGARAEDFVSRLASIDAARLAPGEAAKALWLSDAGGVRGTGIFARYGRERFVLIAAAPDAEWIAPAAAHFDVRVADMSEAQAGLGIVGPYAAQVLANAGLDAALAGLAFKKLFWRGLDVTLSRFGEQGGFELWCAADEAPNVWDRLMRAGEAFGIVPVGLAAADLLDLEAGIARPLRDWKPALCGDDSAPTPGALGLESLIGPGARTFNGRAAYEAMRAGETHGLAGIEIDSDTPVPFAPLTQNGRAVGHTLSSAYSSSLRRAIALARIERGASAPGSELTVTLPPSLEVPELRHATAFVVELPFLPPPG